MQASTSQGSTSALDELRAERDALALLGMLTHLYLAFDPPVPSSEDNSKASPPTHFAGLNIHALALDNRDGEVLALERNRIHEAESPVEHAEQRVIRSANLRLRQKRPRPAAQTVENFYRSGLFYEPGQTPADFVTRGVTVYTSLEPCPMCATTLLVSRVKRVVYILPDLTYGGAWALIKDRFYAKYELMYGAPLIAPAKGEVACRALEIYTEVLRRAAASRAAGTIDTHLFDGMRPLLETAFVVFTRITVADLIHNGDDVPNRRTLEDLHRVCNIPTMA